MKAFWDHLLQEFALPLGNPVLLFSLILFIILLSPILLRRVNIPGIIGLIISGVIIGPHGLNLIEQNSAVQLFSTIGMLYIMFIAGLELDMNEFNTHRNKSLLFGFFTFIIPLGIGFPICHYLLGYDMNASFLTASMFATHTLVAYPIVSRMGISKDQAVAVTVGGTILTDTAVLLVLAVIIANSEGQLNPEFWLRMLGSITLFMAIMFLVIPRVAKWFFSRLEGEKHSHYIFVLSVVFFAAFLAEMAGVEPIIGAFVAGLALNRLIPHSSALMNRIEFIGNALFIPFFLISVGMLVNVRVITSGTAALIVAATLTLVALFSKWSAAYITQKLFGFSRSQRQLIFGLSSAHAAATLAVILVGFKAGILDENILNGTIILILITCLVASFVTENAAKSILVEMEGERSVGQPLVLQRSDNCLIPIANIDNIEKLLELTILMKDKTASGGISILSVVSNDEEAEKNIRDARGKLERFVKQASESDTSVNVIATIDHNAAAGIARIARETAANSIVLGWPRQAGVLDKIIGHKVDSILSSTNRTIFILHLERALVAHKRIVVAVPPLAELEDGFELWFGKLSKLAKELSIPMVLHCNSETSQAAQEMRKRLRSSVLVATVDFSAWEDILQLDKDTGPDDLLVFVSARRSSVSYMGVLENLPDKLERHFADQSRIIIYPEQHFSSGNVNYGGITHGPLERGIDTVHKLSKGLGGLLRKDGDQAVSGLEA